MVYSPELTQAYTEHRDEYSETDEVLFEAIEHAGIANKKVLDLGCGDGKHARHIESMGAAEVLGLDLNRDMIQLAKERTTPDSRIHFLVAEGSALPVQDSSEDLILSNYVIHYFVESDLVFQEAARVLKDDGILIATFNIFDIDPGAKFLENTFVPIQLGEKQNHVIVQNLIKSRAEIEAAIAKSGFVVEQEQELDHPNAVVDSNYFHKDKINKHAMLFVLKKARETGE